MAGNASAPDTRTPEEVGASAMKKAIWRLGPFLGLLYLVAYMDRNNAGFAKLEMTAALQITEAAFGFAAGIFFIGTCCSKCPATSCSSASAPVSGSPASWVSWGLVAALTAFVQDATQFAIARFVLGIAEAGFFPGVLLYLTLWFPRQYRTQVLAVFVLSNPIANAVAAPLSGWMLELHGMWGLDGWQLVFLLQASPLCSSPSSSSSGCPTVRRMRAGSTRPSSGGSTTPWRPRPRRPSRSTGVCACARCSATDACGP